MASGGGGVRSSILRGKAGANSVYSRSVILLTFTNVVIFMMMALIYYGVVSVSLVRQQNRQLQATAQSLAVEISRTINPATGLADATAVSQSLTFAAHATSSAAWVVGKDGEILFKTTIPQQLTSRLIATATGYRLPAGMIGGPTMPVAGLVAVNGLNASLEALSEDWSTAAVPLRRADGTYWGEVQLQHIISYEDRDTWFVVNGFTLSLVVALLVSLLIIGTLSHTITGPIRRMSEAADRVSKGDLTARVDIPGVEAEKQAIITDDLTRLGTTINHMIDMLKDQERERRDFIASVSHDLRTPITSIRGFVEGMLDGTIPPARYMHYLDTVKTEALRMQNLINGMFEMTMLDSGTTRYQLRPFDINELLQQTVLGLEPQLKEKQLTANIQLLPISAARLMVLGDREAISRVVYNLLINAIQFTPPGGQISVSARQVKSRLVEVSIEDSGPGVSEADAQKIFERFYKVDRARTGKGSGLGLYICRSILSAHGQSIKVMPGELHGARFVFTLAAA